MRRAGGGVGGWEQRAGNRGAWPAPARAAAGGGGVVAAGLQGSL